MKTAVIIPVKNEIMGLNQLTDALLAQVSPPNEIVFVDAGSTDGTIELIESLLAKYPDIIKLIKAQGAYPGAARNVGIASTDADIIAQTDGGNLTDKAWLSNLIEPILQNKAEHVTGNVLIMPVYWNILGNQVDVGAFFGASLFRKIRKGPKNNSEIYAIDEIHKKCAGGENSAYLKKVWEKAGGFAGWLRSSEDPLFIKKISQQNIRFAWAQNAISYWQVGPGLKQILIRHFKAQKFRLRTKELIKVNILSITTYIILPLLLILSFLDYRFLFLFFAIFSAITGLQIAKTFWTFLKRQKGEKKGQITTAIILIPCLELLTVLVKITATYSGLISFLISSQDDWTQKVKKYLEQNVL